MTTEQTPPETPISEWLSAFLPLGTFNQESWAPLGAGVLIVDLPVLWLVTAKSLVQGVGEAPLAAFVARGEGGTIVDLSDTHRKSGLSWLEHPTHDLAASLFPIDPEWGLKAFSQAQCAPSTELRPLLPVCSLNCPYGTVPAERPTPFLFSGSLTQVESPVLYSTAPVLGNNMGAPLLLASGVGGTIQLIGILSGTLPCPQLDPRLPPLTMSAGVGIELAWELIRGPGAQEQRKQVVDALNPPNA